MGRLLAYLQRKSFLLLFIALQIFALSQIVRSQSFQRSNYLKTSGKWVGWYWKQKADAREYFYLRHQNRLLQQENVVLRNTQHSGVIKECPETGEKRDTLLRQVYTYLEARAVHHTIHLRNNYIIINKGKIHGIEKGMAVISPQGVVGIIKESGNRYSLAISVLHKNFSIAARPKKNHHFGTLTWNGSNYRRAQLINMPKQTPLRNGDTIVTDVKSMIFPEDIPIGIIKSYQVNPENDFFDVNLELLVDFSKLNEVYIIDQLHKSQIEELINKSKL